MSLSWIPFYIGDYIRDTRTLSMAAHGAYTQMLWHCYSQQGPLPLDEKEIASICNARSHEEIETMQKVLLRFFVRMADGWYQKRVQVEIEKTNAISRKRSDAAYHRWKARDMLRAMDANAMQMQCKSNANGPHPQPQLQDSVEGNAKPIHRAVENQRRAREEKKPKPSAAMKPPPSGVRPGVWEAWLQHRGPKLTEHAVALQAKKLAEYARNGDDPNDVIEQSIASGWTGLFPLKRPNVGASDARAQQRAQTVAGLTGYTGRREPRVIDPDD